MINKNKNPSDDMGGRKCQKFLLVDICEQKHLFQTYGRKMFINLKSNMKIDLNEAQGQRGGGL